MEAISVRPPPAAGAAPRRDDKSEVTQEILVGAEPKVRKKDQGALHIIAGPETGMVVPLPDNGAVVLGRDSSADIALSDPGLSRRHVRFFRMNGDFYVEDLGSTNGVFLEGTQMEGPPRRLHHGDRISLGASVVLSFVLHDDLSRAASEELYEKAVRDPLTKLYNRRYLDERLSQELAFAVRHKSPLTVIMVDVDHFKRFNDTYGHAAGDEVLRAVAAGLQETVRVEDVVARYGGEEVCVIARGIGVEGALALGERLRQTVEGLRVAYDGQLLRVTASFGCATFQKMGQGSVLERADQALYAAKDRGRNCVVHADSLLDG